MNALTDIRSRFSTALKGLTESADEFLGMVRPAQDSKFGDYQANFAMSLGKKLGQSPRDVAGRVVEQADFGGLCTKVEVAGPGFINLTLDDHWLRDQLTKALTDERLGIDKVNQPKTFVVDFSSPNVAKPMHVGHIRSTVIGDAISRILKFLGHKVITDNHLGDWGTQFGMIIYGFRHFRDEKRYAENPVKHLGELYRQVRGLVDYHAAVGQVPKLATALRVLTEQPESADKKEAKEHRRQTEKQRSRVAELQQAIEENNSKIQKTDSNPAAKQMALAHPDVAAKVLEETAALHEGDEENVRLWNEFLPHCLKDIERVYKRLDVTFDQQLGESFYHDQLATVVKDLEAKKLLRESDGATCLFLDGFDTPMIVRKRDGAFLYATTDLATIRYRMKIWNPDAMLYVVDHRQGEHFDKLFAAGKKWGFNDVHMVHVSFGTVLGDDGRPFKTRSGDTVGLEGLLDEAEEKARGVLKGMESPHLAGLFDEQLEQIAKVVGIGALKYADLSQNRASDYKFSYDKMLELKGNTATYLQYLYARVQGVFREGDIDPTRLRNDPPEIILGNDVERQLAIMLTRFSEALDESMVDYRPNILAQYMFELAQQFFRFYDQCHVLKAEDASLRQSRLALCDITARTIRQGLSLLGIHVIDRM